MAGAASRRPRRSTRLGDRRVAAGDPWRGARFPRSTCRCHPWADEPLRRSPIRHRTRQPWLDPAAGLAADAAGDRCDPRLAAGAVRHLPRLRQRQLDYRRVHLARRHRLRPDSRSPAPRGATPYPSHARAMATAGVPGADSGARPSRGRAHLPPGDAAGGGLVRRGGQRPQRGVLAPSAVPGICPGECRPQSQPLFLSDGRAAPHRGQDHRCSAPNLGDFRPRGGDRGLLGREARRRCAARVDRRDLARHQPLGDQLLPPWHARCRGTRDAWAGPGRSLHGDEPAPRLLVLSQRRAAGLRAADLPGCLRHSAGGDRRGGRPAAL